MSESSSTCIKKLVKETTQLLFFCAIEIKHTKTNVVIATINQNISTLAFVYKASGRETFKYPSETEYTLVRKTDIFGKTKCFKQCESLR